MNAAGAVPAGASGGAVVPGRAVAPGQTVVPGQAVVPSAVASGRAGAPTPARADAHAHLRADPERRRAAYGVLVLLALGVFAGSLVDMLLLDGAFQGGVLAGYLALLLVGVLLLFSRREGGAGSGRATGAAAPGAAGGLASVHLRCQHCGTVFRASADRALAEGSGFSCPGCGVFSRLPRGDAERVPAALPESPAHPALYRCGSCGERVVLETFGQVQHRVRFRACPHCGDRGAVRPVGGRPRRAA